MDANTVLFLAKKPMSSPFVVREGPKSQFAESFLKACGGTKIKQKWWSFPPEHRERMEMIVDNDYYFEKMKFEDLVKLEEELSYKGGGRLSDRFKQMKKAEDNYFGLPWW